MAESDQKKLSRVRKPRVHITYDVETEGAVETKELPFVVGVMGDYSGNAPTAKLKPMRHREFVQIDRYTFDEVMGKMNAGVSMKVKDTLSGEEDKELQVDLGFNKMEDFDPAKVADQVPALKELLAMRKKLKGLQDDVHRKEDLEELLEEILSATPGTGDDE